MVLERLPKELSDYECSLVLEKAPEIRTELAQDSQPKAI